MPLDGIMVGKIAAELNAAVDCHVEKIYQPSRDELVLHLRKKDFAKKLLITVSSGVSRIHFTEIKLENPEKPPMFCMLARKHFQGARLVSVSQVGFDRIIELSFEATSEMGDKVCNKIICELIGNKSNIVLITENKIIDSVRRSDILTDSRLIQPGAKYVFPPSQDKLNPYSETEEKIINSILSKKELPLSKSILDVIGGVSPLVAREIVYNSGLADKNISEISNTDSLKFSVSSFLKEIKGTPAPTLLLKDGAAFDFSYMNIKEYENICESEEFPSLCELLDAFYIGKERDSATKRLTAEVNKTVSNLILRANKRLCVRTNELSECKDRELLRIKGEILKANIHLVKSGASSVTLQNFYDENMANIEIKLDPALNAQNNAAKYFKEYKKQNVKVQTLGDFIESDKKEIEYLESVLFSLSRCETTGELREIKAELKESGYIKQQKNEKPRKINESAFKEYQSYEGYKIIVGKNNLQNDYITTKLASKLDTWFHTKNIHGSHVVVFNGGAPLGDDTVLFAATLAAKNSKAANSSQVPVDYTEIRNVKKPSGTKAGMVIYKNNKTIFVKPE